MTETPNLPAPTQPTQISDELERFRTVGYWLSLAESGDETDKARGAAAALRLYYAKELGLPPTAVQQLSIYRGQLIVGAQLQRAMAEQNGYRVIRVASDEQHCIARLIDKESGVVIGETEFTIEDARRAGLIRDRSAWKTHPARMLWARASTLVIRDYAPGVGLGMISPDEAEEISGEIVTEEDSAFSVAVPDEASEADEIDWPAPGEEADYEAATVPAREEFPVPEAVRRYREQQAAQGNE